MNSLLVTNGKMVSIPASDGYANEGVYATSPYFLSA